MCYYRELVLGISKYYKREEFPVSNHIKLSKKLMLKSKKVKKQKCHVNVHKLDIGAEKNISY